MKTITHSELARQDLLSIWLYIAEDNLDAADILLDDIKHTCELLGQNPKMGRERTDIAEGMRYFPVKNYLILYRIIGSNIEIVRVIHGSRELPTS